MLLKHHRHSTRHFVEKEDFPQRVPPGSLVAGARPQRDDGDNHQAALRRPPFQATVFKQLFILLALLL